MTTEFLLQARLTLEALLMQWRKKMSDQNKKAQENFRRNYDSVFSPTRFKDRVDLGLSPSTDVTWVDMRIKREEIEDEQADDNR
jgi:hypothetical protein